LVAADAEALERWADFPVSATPRPLVLVDGYVHVQQAGFIDAPAKRAFLAGAVESSIDVPAAVLELLRDSPGDYDGPPLVVRGVRRSTAAFTTDRGARDLPAYELDIPGAIEPVIVLDPAFPVWWPPTPASEQPATFGPASIEDDDHTLHVPTGGGVLTEFLRCEFIETHTAVLARPVTSQRRAAPDTAIPLVMLIRPVTGRLGQPLGSRVLINHTGHPMTVLPIDHSANNRDPARPA
jgi:hypothetical protein